MRESAVFWLRNDQSAVFNFSHDEANLGVRIVVDEFVLNESRLDGQPILISDIYLYRLTFKLAVMTFFGKRDLLRTFFLPSGKSRNWLP